jgi:enoyl-CoA hydratase/carnithine racemase
MTASDEILFSVEDGIATVTLNRPERKNALSVSVQNRFTELWPEIDADRSIRVVVLTSTDCGVFCAGMDLKEAAEIRARENVDVISKIKDVFQTRMRRVKAPIIAAMTGSFTAGGMLLAINSDLRVGLKGSRCAITEAKVGRGTPWVMPLLSMLPQPLVMELVTVGEWFPVERMYDLGFLNYVEDTPDAVRARARKLAETIRDNAPLSVQAAKASVVAGMSMGCDAALENANRIFMEVYSSQDAIEGPKAFAEKRKPNWQGR